MTVAISEVLDLQGLACPMPILKTKQALIRHKSGDIIKVLATDPHSEIDFKAYLSRTSHELLEFTKDKDLFVFIIQKND